MTPEQIAELYPLDILEMALELKEKEAAQG